MAGWIYSGRMPSRANRSRSARSIARRSPHPPPWPDPRPKAQDAKQPPPTLLLQRLDASSLYCPAPPGAGKSTFCRWAVLQSIPGALSAHPVPAPDGFQEPAPAQLRARLPLLVPLREFWEAHGLRPGPARLVPRRVDADPGRLGRRPPAPGRTHRSTCSRRISRPAPPSCCSTDWTRSRSRCPATAPRSTRAPSCSPASPMPCRTGSGPVTAPC